MPATTTKNIKDRFLALPLKSQCDELGISLDILHLPKNGKVWIFSDQAFPKPEPAAFAHFESQGFKGNFCEGSAPLMLMKCASLNFLSEANTFNDRSDACLRYFEAQCTILQSYSGRIVDEIRGATTEEIRRHFSEIRSKSLYSTLYPEMSIDGLLAIWQSIGAAGWATIAEAFLIDPYTFRAGWPDLSIASGNSLRLIEIKTSDKLHASQKETLLKLLIPLGLHVSVLKIAQPNPSFNTDWSDKTA